MLREVLTVSALILAVLLVRAIFKNRVPKRMVYALWLVVLVKLCLPGTLVSLPVLPAEETAAPVQRAELPAQTAPVVQQPAQAVAQPQILCAAAGFPGAGGRGTGGKAVDNDTDSSDRLVRSAARCSDSGCSGTWLVFTIRLHQEPALSRQARRNAHLCFQRGQIAVSGRADSGGLSDGGRAASERGGIDSAP